MTTEAGESFIKLQQLFRDLLESAPDAIVVVDQRGRITLVNSQAERLFGYQRDELLGRSVDLLVPRRFHDRHADHRHGFFADPRVRPMGAELELFAQHKDGQEFPVEISLSPLATDAGVLVSASIRDVTERRRLEEQLRRKNELLEEQSRRVQEANRLKSEFLANMSHELRTPLNAVIGFAEIIHDGKAGPVTAEQKEFLGDILTSSQHLLQLINGVLDLAKVESGKLELRPEVVLLSQLVAEVREGLRTLAAAKRIRMTTELEEVGPLLIDASKLKQVLYNYLSNAIKFTNDGGRVCIRARREAGRFRIEVEDTGIGISQSDLGRLFVEFQQLDSSAAKRHPGTGLGLALTKRLVEAMGGTVSVSSSQGVGSVFAALLPLQSPPGIPARDDDQGEAGP